MCLSMPKPPPLPKPPPIPNRADDANQSAVQQSIKKLSNNGNSQTNLTGGLGDAGFGQNVNAPSVTSLGRTQ